MHAVAIDDPHGAEPPPGAEALPGESSRPEANWRLRALGAVGLVILGGFVLPAILGSIEKRTSAELRATLDVRDVQTGRGYQPTIYLDLRNDGSKGTSIDRVRLVVRDFAEVLPCAGRTGSPVEVWNTGVALPTSPKIGDVLETTSHVAYSVAADGAGGIALGLKPPKASLKMGRQGIYRFKVEFRELSTRRWVEAGDAVLLVPALVADDFSYRDPLGLGTRLRRCVTHNRRVLRRITAGSFEASGGMRALVVHIA